MRSPKSIADPFTCVPSQMEHSILGAKASMVNLAMEIQRICPNPHMSNLLLIMLKTFLVELTIQ